MCESFNPSGDLLGVGQIFQDSPGFLFVAPDVKFYLACPRRGQQELMPTCSSQVHFAIATHKAHQPMALLGEPTPAVRSQEALQKPWLRSGRTGTAGKSALACREGSWRKVELSSERDQWMICVWGQGSLVDDTQLTQLVLLNWSIKVAAKARSGWVEALKIGESCWKDSWNQMSCRLFVPPGRLSVASQVKIQRGALQWALHAPCFGDSGTIHHPPDEVLNFFHPITTPLRAGSD